MLRRLSEIKNSIDPNFLPPLAFMAKVVGISIVGLEYLHTKIFEQIKTQYQTWLLEVEGRKQNEAFAIVCEYIDSDVEKNRVKIHS